MALDAHHVTRRVGGHGAPHGKLPRFVGPVSHVRLENEEKVFGKDEQHLIGETAQNYSKEPVKMDFPAEHS